MKNSVILSKKLISFKSITPDDDGIMQYLSEYLTNIGFTTDIQKFSDISSSAQDTLNLYAERNNSGSKNLCFAGHVDVVPSGKAALWTYPPFEPTVDNGVLYGRGACDMKCAIACFVAATEEFITENKNAKYYISFLITGDEEGNAINGTKKMLQYVSGKGIKIDSCIVGEPTSASNLGDTIKIGRRGSVSFTVEIIGTQGHVAYPALAKNPVTTAAEIVCNLKNHKFDDGNEWFQATNLEVTSLETSTKTSNVIPESCSMLINVRFNNIHTSCQIHEIVESEIKNICNKYGCKYKISTSVSGEAFLTEKSDIATIAHSAIQDVLGVDAEFSTSGGTSDARFIKDYARVIELGHLNATAHKINENVSVEDINNLTKTYKAILEKFFL